MLQSSRFVALFVVCLTLFAASPAEAANRDVCATCTYTTIEDAMLAVQSGDVIRIAGGTYSSHNDINPSGTNFTLTIRGGYNATFTARDSETILSGGSIAISPFFSGSVTFDGLTITAQQNDGIYFASSSAHLTVNNCRIHDNPQSAIYIAPYYPDYDQDISATFNITNNLIYGHNTTQGAVTVNLNDPTSISSTVNITDNVIYDTAGSYSQGIRVFYSGDAGHFSIARNELYENQIGLYVQLYSGTAPDFEIFENEIHNNRYIGMQIYGSPTAASMSVHHNRFYRNSLWGAYHHNPGTASYFNNTFATQSRGLQLIYATGSPSIRNNIFYDHDYLGLFMSSNEGGFGGTAMVPSALRYNDFFNPTNNGGRYLNTGLAPAYSYGTELRGDFNDMNQFAWTEGNFKEDPRFIDPEHDDYRLSSDSFCIDEGDPNDSSSSEPAPNDNRVNLGAYGNSTTAETSPSAVVASSLSPSQNGNAVDLTYNTTTATAATWISLEYWNGSTYAAIPSNALSGTGYIDGYLAGRMPTGTGKVLSWTTARDIFDGTERNDARLRLTAFHGNQSSAVTSSTFSIDYKAPTVSLTAPTSGTYLSLNGATLGAAASDSGSGVGSVAFRYKAAGAGSFTNIASDSAAPYSVSSSGITFVPGQSYIFEAVATDNAGNTATSSDVTVTACSFTLPTNSVSVADGAQTGSFSINTPSSSCDWTAQSNASWITLTGATAGAGNASVNYSIADNPVDSARIGTITAGGITYTITQAGKTCQYAIASQTTSFASSGGSGTLTISASPSSCAWQVASNASWIQLASTAGNGSASVSFQVDSNSQYSDRSGSISLGGTSVPISQSASPLPQFQLLVSVSGPGTVAVLPAAPSCGANCYVFTQGDQVTLQPAAVNSSTFAGWTGPCAGAATGCTFQIDADTAVSALFTPHPAGLSASTNTLAMTTKQKSKKIAIRNTTQGTLSITGAIFNGNGVFKFSRPKFPLKLKKGKSKSFSVSFKAKLRGSYTGVLILTTDDPFAPQIVVSLSGLK